MKEESRRDVDLAQSELQLLQLSDTSEVGVLGTGPTGTTGTTGTSVHIKAELTR